SAALAPLRGRVYTNLGRSRNLAGGLCRELIYLAAFGQVEVTALSSRTTGWYPTCRGGPRDGGRPDRPGADDEDQGRDPARRESRADVDPSGRHPGDECPDDAAVEGEVRVCGHGRAGGRTHARTRLTPTRAPGRARAAVAALPHALSGLERA